MNNRWGDNKEVFYRNPNKAYNKMAVPLILFAICDALTMFVDVFWAEILGSHYIIPVSICTPIVILVMALGTTIGQGTNSLMSKYFGSENIDSAKNVLMHGFLLCIVMAIVFSSITVPFMSTVLSIMKVSSAIEVASYYLTPICFCSFIFIFIEFCPETLQSEGETRIPTIFMLIFIVGHFILDPILALGFNLGIFGLSLAYILSAFIPFVLYLYLYVFNSKFLDLDIHYFKPNLKIFLTILKVTIPNVLDKLTATILGTFINRSLTMLAGVYSIGCYTFLNQLCTLMSAPSKGASRSGLTISAYLVGSDTVDNLKSFYFNSIKKGIGLCCISIVLVIIFIDPLVQMLIPDYPIQSKLMLIGCMIECCLLSINYISSRLFDGLGKSIYTLLGSISRVIMVIPFTILLEMVFDLEGGSIFISMITANIVIDIVFIAILLRFFSKLKNGQKI